MHKIVTMTRQEIAETCIKARGEKTKYRLSKESGLTIGQIERIEKGKENYTIDLLARYIAPLKLKLQVK